MPAPLPRARLLRDRPTVGLYAPFVVWGWLLYSFNPSVPLLADELGVSAAQAGLHGTAMAAGGLVAAPLIPRAARRLGRRTTLVVAVLVVAVGVVALLTGPSLPWTLGGVLVTAVGGNLLLATAQVALSEHHGRAASAAITEANGVGAGIGLLGPLAVGACVALGWGWRPGVAVTAALALLTALVVLRLPRTGALDLGAPPRDAGAGVVDAPGGPPAGTRPAPRPRAAPYFLATLVAATSLEFATTFWATDLVLERTDAGAGIATATTAGLVAGMTVMRFVVGPLSLRVPPALLLAASFVISVGGWAVLWTATSTAVALTGLVVAGLGYGAQYPLAVALLLAASPGRGDRAQSHATLAGALAVGVAPFALGALADRVGSHQAFVLVPVVAVVGLVTAVLGGRAVRRTGVALGGSTPWHDPTSDPSPTATTPASPTTSP
ncbi:MFS transporter [Cellulomonas shaoxiangyii]|uniref:MFS transporter n=1 Tax=Cellulomonas shaoxiangyii TaxID=2566013 RepID=A0A4P7SIG8_9CELL|nr:MFS transporter [Cellulomonas shaoxiangyii]QCB93428.1 MFS transporter [Cellulomonas shaoxiangyii]TGY84665.1 MFS transporter [Cellulomonas shaoxiangyii]